MDKLLDSQPLEQQIFDSPPVAAKAP